MVFMAGVKIFSLKTSSFRSVEKIFAQCNKMFHKKHEVDIGE